MIPYNMDSDDSDEDENEDMEEGNRGDTLTNGISDIQILKEKSNDLLDTSWKLSKNKILLAKMLELEEPSITPKMVDFLLQDGVCELLMGFITQTGTNSRPTHTDVQSDAMKFSYRATILLSAEDPTETLLAFVSKRAGLMARNVFEIFRDDSAGSFHHAHRLLEFLLRHYPGEVYEGLVTDGMLALRMTAMLRFIGHEAVGNMLGTLVCLTPAAKSR
jgi:hypothetical protein